MKNKERKSKTNKQTNKNEFLMTMRRALKEEMTFKKRGGALDMNIQSNRLAQIKTWRNIRR